MTGTTWHNPIVAEIHAARERLAEQYHSDLLAYSRAAESHCRALGFSIMESTDQQRIRREPKKPTTEA